MSANRQEDLLSTTDGCWPVALLFAGIPLTLVGLAVTGFLFFSGPWTLAHMYQFLWASVPMLIIGVAALILYLSVRKR